MRISFIGMSNIGKSFWSKRLANARKIVRADCDMLIETALGDEFIQLGYHGIRDVAKWMGQPYDPQYRDTSAKYIAHEGAVMRTLLEAETTSPVIIDTTGSVIYTDDAILARLRETTQVIYLETSEKHIDNLFHRYIAHPKPVIWGDSYAPLAGENAVDALKRCYPILLQERMARYHALAHVTIPFDRHKNHKADINALIEEASR